MGISSPVFVANTKPIISRPSKLISLLKVERCYEDGDTLLDWSLRDKIANVNGRIVYLSVVNEDRKDALK